MFGPRGTHEGRGWGGEGCCKMGYSVPFFRATSYLTTFMALNSSVVYIYSHLLGEWVSGVLYDRIALPFLNEKFNQNVYFLNIFMADSSSSFTTSENFSEFCSQF